MGPGAWRDVPISRSSEVERGEEWEVTGPTAPPLPPQQATEYHVPLRDESFSSSPSRTPPPTSPPQVSSAAEPWLSLDEGDRGPQGRRARHRRGGVGGVAATQAGAGVGVSPFPTAPTSLVIREEGSLYPPVMTGGGGRDRAEEQQQRRQRRWKDDHDDDDDGGGNDDMSTRPPSALPTAGNWGSEIAEGGSVPPYYLPVGSSSGGPERGREGGGRGGKHKAGVSMGTSETEDDWNSPQPLLTGSTSRPQESRGRGGSSVEGGGRTAGGGGGRRAGGRQGGGGSPSSSSNAGGRVSPFGTEQGYSRGIPDHSYSSCSSGGRLKPKRDRGCDCNYSWLVPAIVVACCIVFVISMYRNNCPENGGAAENKCVLPFLGRFSFEPLKMNPMIGPSARTLLNFGALETELLRKRHKNKYLLFTYVWLHAGVVHLVLNMLGVLVIGLRLEQEFGAWRTLLVYLVSAFGGSLMSALLLAAGVIVVGASGALFGLLGATLAELIVNWTIYGRRMSTLLTLLFLIAVNLLVGLTPHVDNFSHIGGFVSGVLLGFVFLVKPQFGYLPADYNPVKSNGYKDYTVYPVPPLPGGEDPHLIIMPPGAPPKRKHNQFQRTMRCVAFALLLFGFTSATALVLLNVDGNQACSWCKYMDCVKTPYWNCDRPVRTINCTLSDEGEKIITCPDGKKSFPLPVNTSQREMEKMCVNRCD